MDSSPPKNRFPNDASAYAIPLLGFIAAILVLAFAHPERLLDSSVNDRAEVMPFLQRTLNDHPKEFLGAPDIDSAQIRIGGDMARVVLSIHRTNSAGIPDVLPYEILLKRWGEKWVKTSIRPMEDPTEE